MDQIENKSLESILKGLDSSMTTIKTYLSSLFLELDVINDIKNLMIDNSKSEISMKVDTKNQMTSSSPNGEYYVEGNVILSLPMIESRLKELKDLIEKVPKMSINELLEVSNERGVEDDSGKE